MKIPMQNLKKSINYKMNKRPLIGLGVLILNKNNQVLLGKRKGAHGEAMLAPPGGHLEFGESFEEAAIREVKEETGLIVENPEFVAITNDFFEQDEKHYVSVFMRVSYPEAQEIENLEPHKVEKWEWFALGSLASGLFLPLEQLIAGNGYGQKDTLHKLQKIMLNI